MGTTVDDQHRNKLRVDNEHTRRDIKTARKWVFEKGYGPESAAIERLLQERSLLPIQVHPLLLFVSKLSNLSQSAFSKRFAEHGFNHYSLFVPDLMHEFELGVWKYIYTHILRLLDALGGDAMATFNKR